MTTTHEGHEVETFVYLCTGCPLGCSLEVDASEEGVLEIRGATCKIGERYAKQEHTDPRRPVSTTVRLDDPDHPRLPVRAAAPVPKDLVAPLVSHLRDLVVHPPVARGDVIIADVLGTGIDVIATRSVAAAPPRGAEASLATAGR